MSALYICFFEFISNRFVKILGKLRSPISKAEMTRKNKFRKWILIFRFSSGIKNLPIDPVFVDWVKLIKDESILNCS